LAGWSAAVLAMLITAALVAGELSDAGQRRWWAARALAITARPGGGGVPAGVLDDAVRRLQGAAAPFLALLSPGMRDSIERIGQTPEE
jgi:hypothetical protein